MNTAINSHSLEDLSAQACGEAIHDALQKYGCSIDYVQVWINGAPTNSGEFRVVKLREDKKDKMIVAS